jgi:hypothetical protein
MTARYAIYDPRTNTDVGEYPDLAEAYADIDRLSELHGKVYGVRIAKEHRTQIERTWEIQKVRGETLERTLRGQ